MNDGSGWVKVYRKMTEWEWWSQPYVAHLYLHAILNANYEDRRWRGRVVKAGQFLTSRTRLAEQTGMDRGTIAACLKKLERTGEITVEDNHRYVVITVVRYREYQEGVAVPEPTGEKPADNDEAKQLSAEKPADNDEAKHFGGEASAEIPAQHKNKEYIYHTHCAHAREGVQPFDKAKELGFWRSAVNDGDFKAMACSNLRIDARAFNTYLLIFARECKAKLKGHAGDDDYRDHFYNWLRRQVENPRSRARQKERRPGAKERYRLRNKQIEEQMREEARKKAAEQPHVDYAAYKKQLDEERRANDKRHEGTFTKHD